MRAPVETTACTIPVSIILEMTFPILAMVMAPERVSTTLQSGSRTMARVTSRASPSARPLKAVFAIARRREANEVTLSRSRLSRATRPSERASWNPRDSDMGPDVSACWASGGRGRTRIDRAPKRAESTTGSAVPAVRPPLRGPGPAAARAGPDRGRRPRGGGDGGLRPRLRERGHDQEQHRGRARGPGAPSRPGGAPPRPRRRRAAAPGLQAPVERRARRGLPAVSPSPDARVPRIRGGVLRGGDVAGSRGRRLLPGLLLRPRPGPRRRRALWWPPSARHRRRALLLSLARGRQRLQAAEPLPALDGPEGRGGPRRLDGGFPGDPRHAGGRPHLRDRPPGAADPVQVARLADGPRHHTPAAPLR